MKGLFRLAALIVVLCFVLLTFTLNTVKAGEIDSNLRYYTGMPRTPAVIITEQAIKPGGKYVLQGVGQYMVMNGSEEFVLNLYNPNTMSFVKPVAQVGTGAFLYNGMLVLSTYDNYQSTKELISLQQYQNSNWSTPGIVVDKVLQGADVGSGWYVIYGGGATVLATCGIISTAPISATTLATVAGTRIVIKVVRAVYQDDLIPRAGQAFVQMLNSLPVKHPLDKLPPNTILDPLGFMGANQPGTFGIPGVFLLDGSGSGTWVPLDQMVLGPDGNLINPFNMSVRIPYHNGVDGAQQPIADPSQTGVGVHKPNIYLYSSQNKLTTVTLGYESMITQSKPAYLPGKGWKASVRSGSLNGNGDYLFYEAAVPDIGFQKEYCWQVRSRWLETDMESILYKYGFSQKEKDDFLVYWVEKLSTGIDYVFYPQETIIVDRVMPISCKPAMKHSHRIWFYIKPDEGQRILEPKSIETIDNRTDTLVEWGGILN